MNRRELLRRAGAAAAVLGVSHLSGTVPFGWAAPAERAGKAGKRKLLVFTRSQGVEHSCLKREAPDKLFLFERIVTGLVQKQRFKGTVPKKSPLFYKHELRHTQ